jgi:hypothetical protein
VTNGVVEPSFLVDRVTGITGSCVIGSEPTAMTAWRPVRISYPASGMVENKRLVVSNLFEGDPGWDAVKNPEIRHIVNDYGGVGFRGDARKTGTGEDP